MKNQTNQNRTKFILNDLVVNDKRITVTKIVTVNPEAFNTDTKFVIRVQKNGTGYKRTYRDPQDVLTNFAKLIKG